jgi:hypothetical protein
MLLSRPQSKNEPDRVVKLILIWRFSGAKFLAQANYFVEVWSVLADSSDLGDPVGLDRNLSFQNRNFAFQLGEPKFYGVRHFTIVLTLLPIAKENSQRVARAVK